MILLDSKVTPEEQTFYWHSGRIIDALGNKFDPAR
jgi:hypothetical protein